VDIFSVKDPIRKGKHLTKFFLAIHAMRALCGKGLTDALSRYPCAGALYVKRSNRSGRGNAQSALSPSCDHPLSLLAQTAQALRFMNALVMLFITLMSGAKLASCEIAHARYIVSRSPT
jgi:hypothetical protein